VNRPARGAPLLEVLRRAAEISGLDATGAITIRNGSNAIFTLAGGVVARVGQPGQLASATRELRISRWLNDTGIPTVAAVEEVSQPVVVDDRPVTWWRLIPEHRPSTPAELGEVLRALHSQPPPATFELPTNDPLAGLSERLHNTVGLTDDDRTWLIEHLDKLWRRYAQLPDSLPLTVIHGDAWQGNVVVPVSGVPIVLDLDKVSLGHREWDLIQIGVDFVDFDRIGQDDYRSFVAAYGGYDVTAWTGFRTLADVQELRWVAFALGLVESNEAAAREARHRIACLRGAVPKPWTWKAL
jgi:aminoglycoside phosphotransferase (APT) family kinase protein